MTSYPVLVLMGAALWSLALGPAGAHPGRTAADGCHYCRTNCAQYGVAQDERHCHRDDAAPVDAEPPPLAEPERAERVGDEGILRRDFVGGFTVWIDCARRGAIKFRYNTQRDTGEFPRNSRFFLDPEVPGHCQQTRAGSYRRGEGESPRYDRGHLVPANHLDHSEAAIRQSNAMTNILPQVAQMNRGAWLHTEEIIECYRDLDELLVIGGVLWGDDPADDHFLASHGVETPDRFWKVVVRGDGRSIGWLIPNRADATYANLDRYLVSLRALEQLTGEAFPTDDFRKDEVPSASWLIPRDCNKG